MPFLKFQSRRGRPRPLRDAEREVERRAAEIRGLLRRAR